LPPMVESGRISVMAKIIMCVDMDAFFASVEQRDNPPELWGKPKAVTGEGERTVITTSSYEARTYDVKTGMATAPHLIFVVRNKRSTPRYALASGERRAGIDVDRKSVPRPLAATWCATMRINEDYFA